MRYNSPQRPAGPGRVGGEGTQGPHVDEPYNARPQWLTDAHATLDAAVAVAYGWDAVISEEDVLRNLPALNAAGGKQGDRSVKRR